MRFPHPTPPLKQKCSHTIFFFFKGGQKHNSNEVGENHQQTATPMGKHKAKKM